MQNKSHWRAIFTQYISDNNKIKYFNYSLQKCDEMLRGVCFSTQKYTEIKTLEKKQKSCKTP